MSAIALDHFRRAAADVGSHGDNDTLPFDVDNRFVKAKQEELAELAYNLSSEIAKGSKKSAASVVDGANIFSERLLAPTGPSGFRIITKIHPFWTIYMNGLCVAVAQALEPSRSERVHSYRFLADGDELFNREASWRAFRLATVNTLKGTDALVVQTDVSSFYDHVYHHRLENCIEDLFPGDPTVAAQIDRILNRLAAGRSFGLPVGGQGSRVLAEVLLSQVDQRLDASQLDWRRYVDDFVITTSSHAEAYRSLSILSDSLADYGLTLNRTNTTILSAKHYGDYVRSQLGLDEQEAQKLLEIDLYFDPYSDDPFSDLEELREVVAGLDITKLLDLELSKSQPDGFLVSQISRTLKLHNSEVSLQLCRTLLAANNLHTFRASWSKLMRGVAAMRADTAFDKIFDGIDILLDAIPSHSSHLLMVESNILHYLRTLRFKRTPPRDAYVLQVHQTTKSQSVRRACLDCWRHWKDRSSFTRERNKWSALMPEEQRMLWLAAGDFGDEGEKFRNQVRHSAPQTWRLGIERAQKPTFASIFTSWDGK